MCRSRFDENKRIHGQILHNNMSGRGCIRCRVLWEQRLKIHEINFQIAAFCVISVYSLKPEENEQLYVLIDPASSSSGLLSNHKHGVHGKLVFPNLVEVLLSLCCLFLFYSPLGDIGTPWYHIWYIITFYSCCCKRCLFLVSSKKICLFSCLILNYVHQIVAHFISLPCSADRAVCSIFI